MTISRVSTVPNCWQWANFTMGPNGQNPHFAELRQNICLFISAGVLLRDFPRVEGNKETFCGIKEKKPVSQTQVRQTIEP